MLLLTSGCKPAPAQYTNVIFGASTKSFKKQIKTKLMLYKPLFIIIHVKVKGLFKAILEYKNNLPHFQSGCGTCIARLHKC